MIFFHYGTVVDNLDTAMSQMSKALGIGWRPITESEMMPVWSATGAEHWSVRRAWSFDGPPYIELIDDCSGLTDEGGPLGRHHIGYWSEDVRADGARLEAAGCRRMLADPSGQGYAVYRSPAGVYLELITAMARDVVLNT